MHHPIAQHALKILKLTRIEENIVLRRNAELGGSS